MSPVSRKRKRKSGRAPLRPVRRTEVCDCPECTEGPGPDVAEFTRLVLQDAESLVACEDPLEAQAIAAMVLTIGAQEPTEFEEFLTADFVPGVEAAETPGALALLLALASVAPRRAAAAARRAADRLAEPNLLRPEGIAAPAWAAELREPVTVTGASRLLDPEESVSILAAGFSRAGRTSAMIVIVDHDDCGAAMEVLVPEGALCDMLTQLQDAARADGGGEFRRQELSAAEFRWWAEQALDARAVHDSDAHEPEPLDPDPDSPPYIAMATLLRSQLAALPAAKAPRGAVRIDHEPHLSVQDSLETLQRLLAANMQRGGRAPQGRPGAIERAAKLPPKRKKSAGPAPTYQVKASLNGAKPPIWRRLELPADIGLAELHEVLQTAFGWSDDHLHEFDTPYGRFGTPDPDPMYGTDRRAEHPVTLEQVARGVGARIRYLYDFGDGWEHYLEVEKVLDPVPGTAYPRCTGGRRAGPPEDCGGVWGYLDLVDILADPQHKEHEDRLGWLGLADAAEFDPAHFSADEVTKALTGGR